MFCARGGFGLAWVEKVLLGCVPSLGGHWAPGPTPHGDYIITGNQTET